MLVDNEKTKLSFAVACPPVATAVIELCVHPQLEHTVVTVMMEITESSSVSLGLALALTGR